MTFFFTHQCLHIIGILQIGGGLSIEFVLRLIGKIQLCRSLSYTLRIVYFFHKFNVNSVNQEIVSVFYSEDVMTFQDFRETFNQLMCNGNSDFPGHWQYKVVLKWIFYQVQKPASVLIHRLVMRA